MRPSRRFLGHLRCRTTRTGQLTPRISSGFRNLVAGDVTIRIRRLVATVIMLALAVAIHRVSVRHVGVNRRVAGGAEAP
jgi:hypothetical protein